MIETIYEALRDRFEKYRAANFELSNALRIAEGLKHKSLSLGSLKPREVDVVNSRDLSARYEDLIVDAADIERIMSDKIEALAAERETLMELIALAPADLGLVLIEYYINGRVNADLCELLTISDQRSVQKVKKKALIKIAERLINEESYHKYIDMD